MHFFPTFNSTRKRIINKWIWFLKIITSTQYRTLRMHQLKLTTNTCIHQISHLYLLSKPKSIRLSILWKKIPLPTRQETSNLFTFSSSDAYLAKMLPMQWSWMALWSSLPLIVYLVECSFYQPKSQPKQRGGIPTSVSTSEETKRHMMFVFFSSTAQRIRTGAYILYRFDLNVWSKTCSRNKLGNSGHAIIS